MDVAKNSLLLVAEERRNACVLARMLREDGYAVEVLFDGGEAIERLARGPLPDVLITDLGIPTASGMAVAEFARSCDPEMPVLLLTGYPQLVGKLSGHGISAAMVHTKPIDYATFSEQLSHLMGVFAA